MRVERSGSVIHASDFACPLSCLPTCQKCIAFTCDVYVVHYFATYPRFSISSFSFLISAFPLPLQFDATKNTPGPLSSLVPPTRGGISGKHEMSYDVVQFLINSKHAKTSEYGTFMWCLPGCAFNATNLKIRCK